MFVDNQKFLLVCGNLIYCVYSYFDSLHIKDFSILFNKFL